MAEKMECENPVAPDSSDPENTSTKDPLDPISTTDEGEIIMADPVSNVTMDDISQAVRQAAQDAAQQAVTQVGQQIAEQIGQSVSQAIQKFMQTTGTSTQASTVVGREELGDIGGTERLEEENIDRSGLTFSNQKRTSDEYQGIDVESSKRYNIFSAKLLNDLAAHDNRVRLLAERLLSNGITGDALSDRQAIRHGDIAIDRQWNVNETDFAAADILKAQGGETTAQKALSDLIVQAVSEAITKAKTV